MATVTREPIGELHEKLVVSLTKDDYFPPFEKALKQYGKTASIPGFRKGNVPAGMIRKMYGQSVFADEVIRSANQELNNYLQENKPEIFAQPLVVEDQDLKLDMNKPEDLQIAFEIGLKPEFEVTPLKEKGKLTKYVIEVSDDLLKKETDNLLRRTGNLENPETPEEPTDMVYSSYVACDENGEAAEDAAATEDVVTLENLPAKIAEAVKGQKAGFTYIFKPSDVCEEKDLEAFMKSALKKDVSDKNNFFKMTLTKTGRLIPSVKDEEFFKKVFPNEEIKDEAQFDVRLKEELGKEALRVSKERLENDLYETLVHETQMDLPVDFLKNWLKRGGEKAKTDEEVEREFPSFDHQLRWTLISDKLIKDLGIEVSEEEVMNDLKGKIMTYFGMNDADDAPWMEEYMKNMSKDTKTLDETYRRLLFDKLFVKVADEMAVNEKTVDEETFAQLQPAHHHHH